MLWNHNTLRTARLALAMAGCVTLFMAADAAIAQTGEEQFRYLQYCSSCHLVDGSGVPPEVPNLRRDLGNLLDTPGGREYIVRVQGVTEVPLPADVTANVLNWIMRNFYPDREQFVPFTKEEVEAGRADPLYDPISFREENFPELY